MIKPATRVVLLLGLVACGTTNRSESPFAPPNELMGEEIDNRIAQIPFQHREELFNNLLWLAQTGEQAIPSLLEGLESDEPKVRANCAWVLGQIGDRRTIRHLRPLIDDRHDTVRLEAARTLVVMGDLQQSPMLIEALDNEQPQVRYYCHEALRAATGRDFGYDHLNDDVIARMQATYRWRQWWSEQSGDPWFAKSYAEDNGLMEGDAETMTVDPDLRAATPAPSGETKPDGDTTPGEELPDPNAPLDTSATGSGDEPMPETEAGTETEPKTAETTPVPESSTPAPSQPKGGDTNR